MSTYPVTAGGGTGPPRKIRAKVKNALMIFLEDHPYAVSASLLTLVAIHAVVASLWIETLNPYVVMGAADKADAAVPIAIYVGMSAAAAILAGLAGVVLVFTIGSPSSRIRKFRSRAGAPLQRTWIASLAEPCIAALLGIIASILQTTEARTLAPWIMEAGLVLLVHGGVRILLLLRELVLIVAADDHDESEKERQVPLAQVFRNRN